MKQLFHKIFVLFVFIMISFKCQSQKFMFKIDWQRCDGIVYSMGFSHFFTIIYEGLNNEDFNLKADSANFIRLDDGVYKIHSIKKSEGYLNIKIINNSGIEIDSFQLYSIYPPVPSVTKAKLNYHSWALNCPLILDSLDVFNVELGVNESNKKLQYSIESFESYFFIDSQLIYQSKGHSKYFSNSDRAYFDKFKKRTRNDYLMLKNINVRLDYDGFFIYYLIPEYKLYRYTPYYDY